MSSLSRQTAGLPPAQSATVGTLLINTTPSYLIGVGTTPTAGYRIEPPELATGEQYDNMCNTVTRAVALERFKNKNPTHFQDQPLNKTNHEKFEKWQKAYKFWNGEYSISTQRKVQAECPQEVQSIRAHLWEIIQDEDMKSVAEFEEQWDVKAVFRLRECLRSSFCKAFGVAVVVVSVATVIILKTKNS